MRARGVLRFPSSEFSETCWGGEARKKAWCDKVDEDVDMKTLSRSPHFPSRSTLETKRGLTQGKGVGESKGPPLFNERFYEYILILDFRHPCHCNRSSRIVPG